MGVERDDVVGKPTGASTVHVERGPASNFAQAVTDDNPIYRDPAAAADAGFDSLPVPPTFTFALQNWGKFAEDQPEDPTGGQNPMAEVMMGLMAEGGMVLHGEQEFVYHRPLLVGDTLHHEGRITDLYTKESK